MFPRQRDRKGSSGLKRRPPFRSIERIQIPGATVWPKKSRPKCTTQKETRIFRVNQARIAAGGGIEANIARWESQFKSSDGKPLASLAEESEAKGGDPEGETTDLAMPLKEGKISKKIRVGGFEVHTVDLRGTFVDRPGGPVGPSVDRAGYRMLGAIIPTEKHGVWFVKLTGPQQTMGVAEKGFWAMVEGVKPAE